MSAGSAAGGCALGPNGGAARGSAASRKLYDLTKSGGEFTVELWAAPANVTQEDAYLASYSGSTAARNFTVSQHAYQYELLARSSATDANGAPALLTADVDRDAQASLQHVVLTYDPVNGRRLYVNGNFTGDLDPSKGGTLGNWDNSFVFLLGNETSGNRKWQGTIRFRRRVQPRSDSGAGAAELRRRCRRALLPAVQRRRAHGCAAGLRHAGDQHLRQLCVPVQQAHLHQPGIRPPSRAASSSRACTSASMAPRPGSGRPMRCSTPP